MAQQLVARIKRSSKYSHQAPPQGWFAAKVVDDFLTPVHGNANYYRFCDVALGVVVGDKVVELATGKTIKTEVAGMREYA